VSATTASQWIATTADEGRIDRALARRYPHVSRRVLAEVFDGGEVLVNGKVARKGHHVSAGDKLELRRALAEGPEPVKADPAAAESLQFLGEFGDFVAVHKPAAMPSQPLRPGEMGTAAGGIVARYPECATVGGDLRDGGLTHRLDIGTSGVLVAARSQPAWMRMRAAFSAGEVEKIYLALSERAPRFLRCDQAILQRGKKSVSDASGLPAATEFVVLAQWDERCLIGCRASTGRMHQVRLHLSMVGAPIIGDELYGGSHHPAGFFLHAYRFAAPTVDKIDVTSRLGGHGDKWDELPPRVLTLQDSADFAQFAALQ
jgi:23S rRNA pseudouridine1911/1915/1917 synthase